MRKCFDNIKRIKFIEAEELTEIEAMISAEPEAEPEMVYFSEIIKIEGPVECWLLRIED